MAEPLVLDIRGMTCQHCVRAVRNALEAVDGVEVTRVDVGKAELTFDSARTSVAAITDAVDDAGYSATPTAAH